MLSSLSLGRKGMHTFLTKMRYGLGHSLKYNVVGELHIHKINYFKVNKM
jgi:hypothetical protein